MVIINTKKRLAVLHNEARTLLARLHANGDETDELVEFEVTEISTTLKMEAEANAKGWNVLWSTRANLKRTIIACGLPLITDWCGQSVISLTTIQLFSVKLELRPLCSKQASTEASRSSTSCVPYQESLWLSVSVAAPCGSCRLA